jgi:GNAT superfamily N-acetyltransferase
VKDGFVRDTDYVESRGPRVELLLRLIGDGWAETASLAVDPEPRFAGVGVLLQQARLDEMRGRGVRRVRTETDRDILAKASYISFDWHNVYHPIGLAYVGTGVNPDQDALATGANWEQVFTTKNIGIVKGVLND